MTGRRSFALLAVWLGACAGEAPPSLHQVEQEVRPTEGEGHIGNGYGEVTVSSWASPGGGFRVWWPETGEHRPPGRDADPADGVPDYPQTVAATADRAAAHLAELGFGEPLSDEEFNDGGDFGGDARFDIYLVNTHGGDGYSVTEGCIEDPVFRCAGYIALENDFYGYGYPSIEQAIEVLISHEYLHAVHNAVNADIPLWWSEATATWFEEEFNPAQEDFERLASLYFEEPGRSLNSRSMGPSDGYAYGTALFPYFIAESWGPEAVAAIVGRTAGGGEVETHIEAELVELGSTLSEAFQAFSVWNLFTGDRAVEGQGYPAAADLPEMPLVALDGAQALNWDLELGALAAGCAELSFNGPITVELRRIEGWTNTSSAALVEPALFAESGAYVALDPEVPVRLEAAASPVFLVMTNGHAEDRGAAQLAVRLSTDEPEGTAEPAPEPTPGEESGEDAGCSVSGGSGSLGGLWSLVAVGLIRRQPSFRGKRVDHLSRGSTRAQTPGSRRRAEELSADRTSRCGICPRGMLATMKAATRRTWGAGALAPESEARFIAGVEYCGRLFLGESEAHLALWKLVDILERENLPYAIIAAMALNEYGHRRATVGVDVLIREEDLQTFKRRFLGRGYAERVPGTGKLIDTEHQVQVDVLSAGRFPGDDKPKPIVFPTRPLWPSAANGSRGCPCPDVSS